MSTQTITQQPLVQQFKTVEEYIGALAKANPQEAVAIAVAERGRAAVELQKLRVESEGGDIEFDHKGRITKSTLKGLLKYARIFADGGEAVPAQYRNNVPGCFIACDMSARLGVSVFAFMQSSYIVHGKPGIEAKMATALLNTSGKIIGRIKYRETRNKNGQLDSCQAYVTDAESKEEATGPMVDWKMVEAEGWSKKTGSKWLTMPEVMFPYRAAIMLIRKHYPEVLMGIKTAEELEDTPPEETTAKTLEELNERMMLADGAPPLPNGTANGHVEKPAEPAKPETKATEPETKPPAAETKEKKGKKKEEPAKPAAEQVDEAGPIPPLGGGALFPGDDALTGNPARL